MTDAAAPQPPPSSAEATQDIPHRPEAGTAPPPVHAGWAVASLLFFWPLAFSAFTHAFNVYPRWAAGDAAAARAASERVRRLGQLSLWLFGALLVLLAILCTVSAVVMITQGDGETLRHGSDFAGVFRDARE
jgi:Interferon-induced transmembrane protein